jgi:hypothetical protein
MKNRGRKFSILHAATAVAFLLCLISSVQARAADSSPPCMPRCCTHMAEMHARFLKIVKNQDAELASQAEKIRAASGDAKQGLIEATLLLMIQQQSAQHAEMEKMITEMKGNAAKGGCAMKRNRQGV